MNALNFAELCMRRDLAAYNCVGAIQFVLSNFEAQDFEEAETHLRRALNLFQRADQSITEYHNNFRTENTPHVNTEYPGQ